MRFGIIFLPCILIAIGPKTTEENVMVCEPTKICDQQGACRHFNSLNQLDTSGCNSSDLSHFPSQNDSTSNLFLTLYPDQPLILDNKFNLDGLINLVIGANNLDRGVVWLYDFAGFDLNLINYYTPVDLFHRFLRLRFNFYLNGDLLDLSCQNTNWLNMYNYSTNVLNLFAKLQLKFANTYFPPNICPSVFNKANLSMFWINGGQMHFDSANYSFLSKVETSILKFVVEYAYKLDLNNKTLHPSVFRNVQLVNIKTSSIYKIQADVFCGFDRIQLVDLYLINLRAFLHFNQIYWIRCLNYQFKSNNFYLANTPEEIKNVISYSVELKIQTHLNNNDLYPVEFFPYFDYRFPDEDFCLFAPFPHENIIIPEIYGPYDQMNCTCTLKWIMKYMPFYQRIGFFKKINYSGYELCENVTEESCSIETRLKECLMTPVADYQPHYFDLYDLKNSIFSIESIALDIFGPITSVLAVITNILTILVIWFAPQKKRGSKFSTLNDYQLYKYMKWNACINLIYSLIYFLFYTIKCKLKPSDNRGFVSNICFVEQIYINTIASCLKLLANFSFLQMCLNRFILVGNDHNQKLVSLAGVGPRKFIFITSIICSILSVIVYFKEEIFGSQSLKDGLVLSEDYYYHDYYWYWFGHHTMKAYMKLVVGKINRLPIISAFMLIHDFFSYFFFCIASTVIDALTVKNLKMVLDEKKKKTSIDRGEESRKAEIKNIIMIILISFFNFLLRFPELFSTIFFYVLLFNKESHYTFKMLCFAYRECLPIVEITNVFFLLALSLNFLFYSIFDHNFQESLHHILDGLRKKIFVKSNTVVQ